MELRSFTLFSLANFWEETGVQPPYTLCHTSVYKQAPQIVKLWLRSPHLQFIYKWILA